jgi:hypothetical protein
MRAVGLALAAALLVPATRAAAQTAADSAAIRAAATDYIQGWYDADAPRMERSLYTGLAKRIVGRDRATRRSVVENLTAAELVRGAGEQQKAAPDQRRQDITILDVFQNMATVKLVASGWVDYMHLGKIDGQWKIVNVMWDVERPPQRRQ